MDARDQENQTGQFHSHPSPDADTPPLPVDSDDPVVSSMDEGQSVFDRPGDPLPVNDLSFHDTQPDTKPAQPVEAVEPTLPDLIDPHENNQTDPALEPLPISASSMPLEPAPAQSEPSAEPALPEPVIAQSDASEPLPALFPTVPAVEAAPQVEPDPAPAEQPFFPIITPEPTPAPVHKPTLSEKLALLKASLPAYPSPIQSPVSPLARRQSTSVPEPAQAPAPQPVAALPEPTPVPVPAPQVAQVLSEPTLELQAQSDQTMEPLQLLQPVEPVQPPTSMQSAQPDVADQSAPQAEISPEPELFVPIDSESEPSPDTGIIAQTLADGFALLPDSYQDIPFTPAAIQAIHSEPAAQTADYDPHPSVPVELTLQTPSDLAPDITTDDNQDDNQDDAIELSPASLDEDSGIYNFAHAQAQSQLQKCPTSPVLALTREVDSIPLEDAGHARLPDAPSLKFTGANESSDAASLGFDDNAHPANPIPLVVSAVAAAGGTAVALGMQSPQDQPDPSAKPQSAKQVQQARANAKKAGKKWWFIPAGNTSPQTRQASRVDRFAGICAIGVLGLMAVLAARVVQLQIKPDPKIAALVDSQNSKSTLHYRRGVIEDRNGRPLSLTRATKSVFMDPGIVTKENARAFTENVGSALKIDPASIQAKLDAAGDKRYVKLVRKASEDQNDALPDLLKNKELKPLGTETLLVRDYPYKNLAAHLLGFVNIDGKGIEGVEKLFDKNLTGQNGAYTYDRDSRHRSLWINQGEYQLPQDGAPVRLSIDITIQRIAEKELSESCKQFQAKSGAAIVMDPRTGEILALAVYPEIDANAYGKTPPELRKNRAITDTYEPGSTFKPFVWAVATEQGYARPLEMLDCGPGFWRSSTGRRLRDSHPVGRATWEEVLVKSSNIGMAIVGERMGGQALYNAVASFGFGKPTGSGLPGEIGGIFHNLKKWTSYSITSIPMGQEISVTPMQMARAYCALANGGTLITPTIQYVDPASPQAQAPRGPQVLKPETAIHTRNVMRRVVLEGTGKQANSKLYSIFGKTGTAQMANPKGGGYEPDAYTGSFACGAPVDDARVVVVTILQRPNRAIGYYGGTIAAPAGMRIVEQTLAYMGVPADVEPETPKSKSSPNSSRLLQANNRGPGR